MLVPMLLVFWAVAALCNEIRVSKGTRLPREEVSAIVEIFPWDSLFDKTGVDPEEHLGGSTSETIACTTKPGPDRLDCPLAISAWDDLVNDQTNIDIPAGQCQSATHGQCRTVVCAPKADLSVPLVNVTGHMWNPISTKCVFGGSGGIWQGEGSGLVIEVGHPL